MSGLDPGESVIPRVDLGGFQAASTQDRRRIAEFVDDTCRTSGFLIVDNHGVDQGVIDAAWSVARAFFDLPLAQKLASMPGAAGSPRGYFPAEQESLARTRGVDAPPDHKESFSSGPLSQPEGYIAGEGFDFFYGANSWPASPDGFQHAWCAYYRAMEELGAGLMRLLATALQVDEDFFEAFHTHHLSALRALNYPAGGSENQAGQQRAGAHSDYGSVTILKPDPDVGGLEIQSPSGDWLSAPPVGDAFIVNIGDLMARWTNDLWVSTMHRVANPGADQPRRQSIAYFMNPNYDATITAIPGCVASGELPAHEAVLAGDYLLGKFRSAIR